MSNQVVFYKLKRFEEALINYNQTIELNPNFAEAYGVGA